MFYFICFFLEKGGTLLVVHPIDVLLPRHCFGILVVVVFAFHGLKEIFFALVFVGGWLGWLGCFVKRRWRWSS